MKLLLISDEECPALWEHFTPERLEGIDMILSCGDLDPNYLSFLATFYSGPLVYVLGNHDSGPGKKEPEGCICADGRLIVQKGLRILGLGGSMRYNQSENQFTDQQMHRRALRLYPRIWRHGGFDILLTHAPARGCGDGDDLPHKGFTAFCSLMDRFHPKLMAHGHVHQRYGAGFQRERQYGSTRVINACERILVDL